MQAAPLLVAYASFIILGLCLITNSQVTSDGGWYLYGRALERGVRLYSDLKLPQQPLFILMTSSWQRLVGHSWILSLAPAALCLITFATGYYLLARASTWPAWQRAIIFLAAATEAIGWSGYRFDDYRVLTDIAAVYSVVALLRLLNRPSGSTIGSAWPLALGALSGLSFTTRANDGLLLLISQAVILFFGFRGQRIRLLLLLLSAFALSAFAVVLLTGDSLAAYFQSTLVHSSSAKGGLGQVALSPLILMGDVIRFLFKPNIALYEAIFIAAAALPVAVLRRLRLASGEPTRPIVWAIVAGLLLFECLIVASFDRVSITWMGHVVHPLLILGLVGLGIWAGLGVLGLTHLSNRLVVLFLVPFGSLIAAGMSSGGNHIGLHGPTGLFIAIVPVAFTLLRAGGWNRALALSACALLAYANVVAKIGQPYDWQFYHARTMFVDRAVIDHPLYGPMIVNRTIDRFINDVCRTIEGSPAPRELLSMPYSYANYYCGIPPWGDYVQTYYDTTTPETVKEIHGRLETRPPAWLLYQRQPPVLRGNEVAFNHGQRSAYRDLDDFIVGQVAQHRWTVVGRWRERRYDTWYLIRTSPDGR